MGEAWVLYLDASDLVLGQDRGEGKVDRVFLMWNHHIGTICFLSIEPALDFHRTVGPDVSVGRALVGLEMGC